MWTAVTHKITIERADTWARWRRLTVLVDDAPMARLWRGRSVDVVVAPDAAGVLTLKMDWVSSEPFDLWSLRTRQRVRVVDDLDLREADMGLTRLPYAFEAGVKSG